MEVVLRMLVVKRLYGFSYEQTERIVSDSIVLRQFCRLYFEPAPDDTTLICWANTVGPDTIEALNQGHKHLPLHRLAALCIRGAPSLGALWGEFIEDR